MFLENCVFPHCWPGKLVEHIKIGERLSNCEKSCIQMRVREDACNCPPWWNNTIFKKTVHKSSCRKFKYKREEAAQLFVVFSVAQVILLVNGLATMDYIRCFRVRLEEEDCLRTSHSKKGLRGSDSGSACNCL